MLRALLCGVIVLFVIIILIREKNKNDKLFKNIPLLTIIPHIPIIGHSWYIIRHKDELFKLIYTADPVITPTRIEFLTSKIVFIARPEDIQIIYNSSKCLSKSYFYKFVGTYIGEGLLTAPVHKWKKNRRIVTPTFNQLILNQFIEKFAQGAKDFIEVINQPDGKTFDIFEPIYNYTFKLIYINALGLQTDSKLQILKLNDIFTRARDIIMKRLTNVFYILDFTFKFTKTFKIQKEDLKYFSDVVQKIIDDKKIKLNKIRNKTEYTGEEKNVIFLDKLMVLTESSDKLTDTELIDEIKTFIVAGTDTTSITTSFVFLMLTMHPEIQHKVNEEVIEVLGSTKIVDYRDIDKFVYLEKVIKETMRLFPVGPLSARQVHEDVKLTTCTVPTGCDVIIGTATLMRSAKYYPDPLKFDPERFNPEEIRKRIPYSYLPFSGGPRNCIGRHYAMASMKTIVSMSVREFWFETDIRRIEDINLKYRLLVTIEGGFPVRATKRK